MVLSGPFVPRREISLLCSCKVLCAPNVPMYASINLLRVDPGYSTHGALQAASENIVSTFVDEDRYAIVVVRPTMRGRSRCWRRRGRSLPAGLETSSSAGASRPPPQYHYFLCLSVQAVQRLQLPRDKAAGVQGWEGQGQGEDPRPATDPPFSVSPPPQIS